MIILGTLDIKGNVSCTDAIISSSIATVDGSAPYSGSTIAITATSELSKYKTIIGSFTLKGEWNNIISIRHRNGNKDGSDYGVYLRASLTSTDSLKWAQQMNSTWSTERTILDSGNYKSYCTPANIGAAAGSHNHQSEALWPLCIELSGSSEHGGFIDFHFAKSTADHTSRIIENASGRISINGTHFYNSNQQVDLNGPLFINSSIYGSTLPTGYTNQIFFKLV